MTVSGPSERVASFGRGRDVLHTETLGSYQRSIVRTEGSSHNGSAARALGLTVEPTSLQQYVVALSRRTEASARVGDAPVRLEEVS